MKPFDLQKAIDGHPLVTRDGQKILEIKVFGTVTEPMKYKFVVYIENDDKFTAYGEDGRYDYPREHPLDLFFYEDEKYTKCPSCGGNLRHSKCKSFYDSSYEYSYGCDKCDVNTISQCTQESAFESWKNFIDRMHEHRQNEEVALILALERYSDLMDIKKRNVPLTERQHEELSELKKSLGNKVREEK